MAKLEELNRGAWVEGVLSGQSVQVVDIKWYGTSAAEVTYKTKAGQVSNTLVYRDQEADLEVVEEGLPWRFDADGAVFRLVSEARRIELAHLFDPLLAVHTSLIQPLPHQIEAVYEEMLPRQPLHFLLADDPGAGKTIMAGLLVRELLLREDVRRCLIVVPGNLVEQWQDELAQKFHLGFEIITREKMETSRTGNVFQDYDLAIARLDQLSRDDAIPDKLKAVDWDLVIVDEAHKMSAHYFGNELKTTKRFRLGELLSRLTRHFLLMSATPHNGKEEDFQLFLSLLDGDRFEGRYRPDRHDKDASDLMRRMQKEDLKKFDGTPLFPERRAYTVTYTLSELEEALYHEVTEYVRNEMNRVDRLKREGQGKRGNTVGFALTTLQRRLASSPEAIYQSLIRRRERLEARRNEERINRRGAEVLHRLRGELPELDDEALDELEDAPDAEVESLEERLVDQATAAETIAELETEIKSLSRLEQLAKRVRTSNTDRKWEELSALLLNQREMFDADGVRRKLVIFSEHLDTVKYLATRLRTLVGRPEAVVVISGGMRREDRANAQQEFTQNKDVQILVATDAAGEGINLQRAHLMINYDLPWNPNRIEQRFGRIHRIGQTEVCHLWNLVADETREGEVFSRLLKKLEAESAALQGRVFNVLGTLFQEKKLRDLLIEAIRYGDRPEVKQKLYETVDSELDHERLIKLIEEQALAPDALGVDKVMRIKEDLDRAQARRLQPHYVADFFLEAFKRLGGSARRRETGRYELTHVPSAIRNRHAQHGHGAALLSKYERVCFEKDLIHVPNKPTAEFVCPGHPLLNATIDVVLERYHEVLKQGTVLVDPQDNGEAIRALFFLEHSIFDGAPAEDDKRHLISRQLQFVSIGEAGEVDDAGYAPYLDYRPATREEMDVIGRELGADWLKGDLEARVLDFAVESLVPRHLSEVKARRTAWVETTRKAVKERLTHEINYWDRRANQLKEQELAGKSNFKLNSARARQRADALQGRLKARMEALNQALNLQTRPPVAVGGALVVPIGLLRQRGGPPELTFPDVETRQEIEALAMEAVMGAERSLGHEPKAMPPNHPGYDIESKDPETGHMRFIEVKGKGEGAKRVFVSKTQILTGLNKPEDFILALVRVQDGQAHAPRYLRRPFQNEPNFGAMGEVFDFEALAAKAERPERN